MMQLILIAGVLNLFIGILVLRKGFKRKELTSFAIICFITSIWALHNFLMLYFNNAVFLRPIYFFGALTIASLLAWSFYYTERRSKHWKQGLIYLAGILAGSLAFIGNDIVGKVVSITDSGIIMEEGPYFIVYSMFVLICFLWAVAKVGMFYRHCGEEKKKEARLIMVGVLMYGGISMFVSSILPTFGIFKYTNLDSPSSLIFAVFTAIAMVKSQFLGKRAIAAQLLVIVIISISIVELTYSSNLAEFLFRLLFFFVTFVVGIILIESIGKEIERKEELQNMADKLASANDELRKLDNAKTEFISIASHQLRTPLTAIKGFLSLVLEGSYGEVNKDVHGALDKTYAATERLIQLVEDLLNVSRIEAGRLEFKFEKASVQELLRELYENFILAANKKKLSLELKEPAKPIADINMDRSKLREVFSNIFDNAIKYTDKGGVTVKAELLTEGQKAAKRTELPSTEKGPEIKGDVVRITVSDTGIGIPAEEMPYLFKKFSRGKDISRLNAGGTGLGIYVGKSIMESHRGRIWVESKGVGMGANFIVELPIS